MTKKPKISEQELAIRRRLKGDLPYYARKCLRIRPKAGGLVPLELNRVQLAIHGRLEEQLRETGKVRALILKARQPGCSTYVEGRFYWKVTHRKGVRAFILTHRQDATDNIFGMVDRFHQNCNPLVRPQTGTASAKELHFNLLDSGYRVGTAGAAQIGRSETIQYLHGSEIAFWPNAESHAEGIMQAVPEGPGTEIIFESTANGIGGMFHRMCQAAIRGRGEFKVIFIPWFWHHEYSDEPPEGWSAPPDFQEYGALHDLTPAQLHWAWNKNEKLALSTGEPDDKICWKFFQEFPATAEEAFQAGDHKSFIKSRVVIRARKAVAADQSHAPLIFGIDTAGDGGDPWYIIDRRGRCMGHLVNESFTPEDQISAANYIEKKINRFRPDRVFMDLTGGYGSGAYDLLKERNYGRLITGVKFSQGAGDDRKYANKRAEMWGDMRDWLEDPGGADIIDSDEMHGDLCAPGFRENNNSQTVLESKEKIIDRIGRSPNAGDSAALTFAQTVYKQDQNRRRPMVESAYDEHAW